MPGYNAQQVANNARNANTTALAIGQNVVYMAQTISHSFSYDATHIHAIGSPKPQEIQQLRSAPSISLTAFALTPVGITLLAAGQILEYLLGGTQFDAYILDGLNNSTALFSYIGCKAGSFSQDISGNSLIRNVYPFLAMDVLDSNGVSLLDTKELANPTPGVGATALGASIGFTP